MSDGPNYSKNLVLISECLIQGPLEAGYLNSGYTGKRESAGSFIEGANCIMNRKALTKADDKVLETRTGI